MATICRGENAKVNGPPSLPGWLLGRKAVLRQAAKTDENALGNPIVDAEVWIHREFGPRLLETIDAVVLAGELEHLGRRVERQVPVPILYSGVRMIVSRLPEPTLGVVASWRGIT